MTSKEKRMTLTTFCAARSCSRCPLAKGFKCGDGDAFLKKKDNGNWSMADTTIDRAYSIAILKKKPTVKKSNKPASAFHNCPYSPCLECDSPDEKCASCGWHPDIKEERLERLKAISLMPPDKNGLRGLRLKRKKSHE